MKDIAKNLLDKETELRRKRLVLGEFLQHLILQTLYRNNQFKNLVFTGGTALRILYHTSRYSEDLDFSAVDAESFDGNKLLDKIQQDLEMYHFGFEFRLRDETTVAKADLRFPDVLQEFGIAAHPNQKLTIRTEIDKNPPAGGNQEIALVTSPVSYTVAVFDLPSMFATKLHAIFFRRYTKGRDYFDLAWYLGKRVVPNFLLLNNAISQTEGRGQEKIDQHNFVAKLVSHLESVDFTAVQKDVGRFLMNQDEIKLLEREAIKSLLRNY